MSISATRRMKLWHWTLPTDAHSRLRMKIFRTQTNLPICAASTEIKEQSWASRPFSNRPESQFDMMDKIWHSSTYIPFTKLTFHHSCVPTTLLYDLECWQLTLRESTKLSIFHAEGLRRIKESFGLIIEHFSIGCHKTKVISWANHKGRSAIHCPIKTLGNYKRRKTWASKSRLVLVLLPIGWESGP